MRPKIVRTLAAALLCLTLTACGSGFTGYDNDIQVANSNSWSATTQSSSETNTHFKMTCGKCSGVKTIADVTVTENPTVPMTLNIDSGRFKVVLVQGTRVYLITDASTQGPVNTTGIPAGKYKMRIVAEEAKFQIDVTFG